MKKTLILLACLSIGTVPLSYPAFGQSVFGSVDQCDPNPEQEPTIESMTDEGGVLIDDALTDWTGVRTSLRATRGWDIATIASWDGRQVLIGGLYGGFPREVDPDYVPWSLLITFDNDGRSTEPRLVRWNPELLLIDARPAGQGFLLRAYDRFDDVMRRLYLDRDGTVEEGSAFFIDPDAVVQPEDMPEGSGG